MTMTTKGEAATRERYGGSDEDDDDVDALLGCYLGRTVSRFSGVGGDGAQIRPLALRCFHPRSDTCSPSGP